MEAELIKPGFDRISRTLFIWGSVPAYLTCDAHDAILRFVGRVPRESKLAFSCAWKANLTGEGLDNRVLNKVSRVFTSKYGIAIHGFGPKPIADQIARFGLTVRDHIEPEEFKKHRRIRERMGLDAIEVERFILAEVV